MPGSRGDNQISYQSIAASSEFSAFTLRYLNKQESAATLKAHVAIGYFPEQLFEFVRKLVQLGNS